MATPDKWVTILKKGSQPYQRNEWLAVGAGETMRIFKVSKWKAEGRKALVEYTQTDGPMEQWLSGPTLTSPPPGMYRVVVTGERVNKIDSILGKTQDVWAGSLDRIHLHRNIGGYTISGARRAITRQWDGDTNIPPPQCLKLVGALEWKAGPHAWADVWATSWTASWTAIERARWWKAITNSAFVGATQLQRTTGPTNLAVCPLCLSNGDCVVDDVRHAHCDCAHMDQLWRWTKNMAREMGYKVDRRHFGVYGERLRPEHQDMKGTSPMDVLRGAFIRAWWGARAATQHPTSPATQTPAQIVWAAHRRVRATVDMEWMLATGKVKQVLKTVYVKDGEGTYVPIHNQAAFMRPNSVTAFAKKWHRWARVGSNSKLTYFFGELGVANNRTPTPGCGLPTAYLVIYTDDSYIGNNKVHNSKIIAGWGAVAIKDGSGKFDTNASVIAELFGQVSTRQSDLAFIGAEHGSNNTGEVSTVVEALVWACSDEVTKEYGSGTLVIKYDSEYATSTTMGRWRAKANKRLVAAARVAYGKAMERYNRVEFVWIRGHSNAHWNDHADHLANLGRTDTCKNPVRNMLLRAGVHEGLLR